MSYDGIRDALKVRLDALSGVGPVHTYERYIRGGIEETAVKTLFFESNVLNTAFIDRKAFHTTFHAEDIRRRVHEISIYLFLGHDDASATGETFQDRLETIVNDLETGNRALGKASTIIRDGCSVKNIGLTKFGAAIDAHIAEITFTVEEVLS